MTFSIIALGLATVLAVLRLFEWLDYLEPECATKQRADEETA